MFEHITASEVAGYGVGTLLLCATISAPKIDAFISSSQRRCQKYSTLGMCKRCGDLRMIACSSCNGFGLVKEGGPFNFITPVSDRYQSFGSKSKLRSIGCSKCKAKGCFDCPECSKLTQD